MAEQIKVICINTCKMVNEPDDWGENIIEAFEGNTYYFYKVDYKNANPYVYISEWDEGTNMFWEIGLFEAKNFNTPQEIRERLINKILEND